MSKKVKGIQIEGLDPLLKALGGLEKELAPTIIRNVARKPANKIVSLARKMFPFKKSGKTKRSFGILKVANTKQRFLEVGIKGRSLAWIFMLGAFDRKKKSGSETGSIKPLGNLLEKAADQLSGLVKEFSVEISKVIAKGFKKHLRKAR